MDIYGIIGWPVKHSLSPEMHNAAFKALGIDAEYLKFEVRPEKLKDFLLGHLWLTDTKGYLCHSNHTIGFNITIPHKVKAKEILEKEFPFEKNATWTGEDIYYVKVSGAINTVKREGDKIAYWNTDADGFLRSLSDHLKFDIYSRRGNVFVVGCGGAGRTIIAALTCEVFKQPKIQKIYIYDKSKKAINSAREHFSRLPQNWKAILDKKIEFVSDRQKSDIIKNCCLLINASPVGMKEGDPSVVDKTMLHKKLYVYDVVYNRKTQLVKDAETLGLCVEGGRGMFLYQGARSFELWTGQRAPMETTKKALLKAL